jgi:hypothetical protein
VNFIYYFLSQKALIKKNYIFIIEIASKLKAIFCSKNYFFKASHREFFLALGETLNFKIFSVSQGLKVWGHHWLNDF